MKRKGKRAVFDQETINRAKAVIEDCSYNDPTIRAVSVLLAGVLWLTSEQIGLILGVSASAVARMNKRFREERRSAAKKWGGDRRSSLPKAGETLRTLGERAAEGKIVTAALVKQALEEQCGHQISLQTAYNALHRHDWRKVRPDKEHPKSDTERQDEFKKKSFPPRYKWLPPKPERRGAD